MPKFKFVQDETESLLNELHLWDKTENIDINGEDLCDDEETLKQGLEEVQRRQDTVFQSAQKQMKVLETLLRTVDSDLGKETQKPKAPAPQAYFFKDIYEAKKKQLLRQRQDEERQQRLFHSRPMPNFQQVHQQMANKPVIHRITCPITPNVLKTSQNMQQNRLKKMEKLLKQREEEQLKQQVRPRAKSVATVNTLCLPLKPANGQTRSLFQPFRLSTEIRAEQRKRFNAQTQQMQENRRLQLEEQRKLLERQEYLKHRHLATFRARPNPFKTAADGNIRR